MSTGQIPCTYERDTGTLFSCDMFGAFGRMTGHYFDDELTPEEIDFFEFEGLGIIQCNDNLYTCLEKGN